MGRSKKNKTEDKRLKFKSLMKIIAGVDEVGRGSLIGPVYAAAVILNKSINSKTLKDSKTLTKEKIKLDEPGMYDVVFLNDSITTMEFVVKVLKQIFNKTPEQAHSITQRIHQDGQGIVGSYSHEVAEQKGIEATLAARQENFPLQVKVKKQ